MLYAKAEFSPYIVSVLIKCEQQWMHRYDHYVSSAPSATTPVISSDATCQKMFTTCISQVDQKVSSTNP